MTPVSGAKGGQYPIHSAHRFAIFSPYGVQGGGAEFQPSLRQALDCAFPGAEFELIDVPSSRRTSSGYLDHGRAVYRARGAILGCDLLVVQGFFNVGSWALAREAALRGVPYVIIPHGDHVPPRSQGRWISVLRKRLAAETYSRTVVRHAAAIVVASQLEGERIVRSFPDARVKLRLIPNATTLQAVSVPRVTPDSPPYAVWIGVLSPEKNLEFLVRCWPHVLMQVPSAQLVLVGKFDNRSLADPLRALVTALGLSESVRFEGYLGGSDKECVLAAARCLVLPSTAESYGRVVAESVAVGTPVVVSSATPWDSLPREAGRRLPLDQRAWVDAMVEYLAASAKATVPLAVATAVLAPSAPEAVCASWRAVVEEAVLARDKATPFVRV